MNRESRDRDAPIEIKKIVSVLPNDYSTLVNLPTINGVSLIGQMSAKTLNLLSADVSEYEPVKISVLQEKKAYLVGIGEEASYKVSVDDLLEESKNVKVTDNLDKDAAIGTIQLVILK